VESGEDGENFQGERKEYERLLLGDGRDESEDEDYRNDKYTTAVIASASRNRWIDGGS
jgi:hypothetical protein